MPDLNDVGIVGHGVGGGYASIQNIAFSRGGWGGWMARDRAAFVNGDDNWFVSIYEAGSGRISRAFDTPLALPIGPLPRHLRTTKQAYKAPTTANVVYAGGNHLAAWQGSSEATRGLHATTGFRDPNAGLLGMGPDASIGYKPLYHSNGPTHVRELNGDVWKLTDGHASALQLLGNRRAVWNEGFSVRTAGLPVCKYNTTGGIWKPVAAEVGGEWWLSAYSGAFGVIFHPFSDPDYGFQITKPNINAWHTVRAIAPNVVRFAIADFEGEQPGQVWMRDLDVVTGALSDGFTGAPLGTLTRIRFATPAPPNPVDPPPPNPEDEVPEIPRIEKVTYDKTIAAGKPWKLEAMIGSVRVTFTKDANDLLWIKAVNSVGQDAATAVRRPIVVEGAAPIVPPNPVPGPVPVDPEPTARRIVKDVSFQCVERAFVLTANRDMEHTPVMATATNDGPWELCDIEFFDDDTIAFRWSNGRYMAAENGGGTVLNANRQQVGPWERFKIVPNEDGVSFKSHDGHFLCAENGGGGALLANREKAGSWERFYPSKPLIGIAPPVTPGEQGRVTISGSTFRAANGSIWQWKGATMFLLFWRYLNGEDISRQIAWMRAHGVNVARVLGMVHWPNVTFGPTAPDYWQKLLDFCSLLRGNGLRVEFVVFASAQDIMPNRTDQRGHLRRVVDTLSDFDNVFIEIANEPWQNGVEPWTIFAPSDAHSVPMAYGMYDFDKSKNGDVWIAKLDTLDYVTAHSPRDAAAWARKAKDLAEIRDGSGDGTENGPLWGGAKKPVVGDEPMGAAERDQAAGRQRSFRPEEFFWYHANAAINGSGSTFHCDAGLQGDVPPPDGDQERCAQMAALAWNNIPAEFQTGQYTRTALDTLPLAWKGEQFPEQTSRIYGRLLGNRAVCVAIEPRGDWTPVGINGWRVVRTLGPMNTLVFLER